MKLTKNTLRKVIREEIRKVRLSEGWAGAAKALDDAATFTSTAPKAIDDEWQAIRQLILKSGLPKDQMKKLLIQLGPQSENK